MPDTLDRLKAALADRYTIRRELGRGGTAMVYLATDLRHERSVALKVLKPELAAVLGPDRFLREIELAAKLTHPHILPLYDGGRAEEPTGRRAAEPAESSAIGHRRSFSTTSCPTWKASRCGPGSTVRSSCRWTTHSRSAVRWRMR